jgi:hypothetical protein
VTIALYSTIWISLLLFVAAQHGLRQPARVLRPAGWVQAANAIGLALCVAHITLAMGWVHGWSHELASAATAMQTKSVYGLRWGGGLFVNYLFVIVWATEAWMKSRPSGSVLDAAGPRWALRIFYGVVIFNAAVVFVRGPMRPAGLLLTAVLIAAWRPKHHAAATL